MKRFLNVLRNTGSFFRHLRWKLAFSYILMTALALLITIAIIVGVVTNWILGQYPQAAFSILRQEAPTVTHDLLGQHVDQQDLSDELSYIDYNVWSGYISDNTGAELGFSPLSGYTVVTNFQGKILASSDSSAPVGARLQTLLSAEGMRIFLAARSGATSLDQTVVINAHMVLIGAKALITKRGQLVGVLLTRQVLPSWQTILFATFPLIWPPVTLLVVVVGIVGVLYSLLMSRGLVRRLKRVAVAAENWSKGDFSLIARDTSGDELGLMARQLNIMAGKLEQLLRERQGLAVLEERNRLARDLHDSLKQRIFAITMQVWSAQAFLERHVNVDAVQERLGIIEHLLDQTHQELSSLIFQLRPIELAEKNLGAALREYCEQWSLQQNITLDLCIEEVSLSLKAEEALLRVAQEALTNVSRHSGATKVRLELHSDLDRLALCISDNGQGFDSRTSNGQGLGLLSMRERMEALGGSIEIESTSSGEGTRITAHYKMGRSSALP